MADRGRRVRVALALMAASPMFAPPARAEEALQWSGFALVRGATPAEVPLDAESFEAQAQIGLDWSPAPAFLAHLHLLARSNDGGSRHGRAGTPEAYVEARAHPEAGRFRLRAGAFFLPTSRENVDALWENPYAISSSALNTWFGQELRPIGVDVSWTRGAATAGATIFRGNDTLGALPLKPGWTLDDRWTLLGQKVPSGKVYASVSAETDHRLGWSARGGLTSSRFSILYTHLDNRSDGLKYGDLYNWNTHFDVVGLDYGDTDWTVAAEMGWGPTVLFFTGGRFAADLRAGYLLVSRRFASGRATARVDAFDDGKAGKQALTVAAFRTLTPRLTLGLEIAAGGGRQRALGELRYRFARQP